MTLDEIVKVATFTVLLGKNGAGKSSELRLLDQSRSFTTWYVSPERGGALKYNANIEQTMSKRDFLSKDRRKNRADSFRMQSAVHARSLELSVLREIEQNPEFRANHAYNFDSTLTTVNELLPNIKVVRADNGLEIHSVDGKIRDEETLSSGESELLALAFEILYFARTTGENKLLILDEPDVHLHPDLQDQLIRFLCTVAARHGFRVILATHSTAILGAFSDEDSVVIVPMRSGDTDLKYFARNEVAQRLLPIFGAHPLSAQFNRSAPLLVEGEDDRRVVDQILRSAQGKFRFSPCVVDTVNAMSVWEEWLSTYLPALYDAPMAYSLRDLDDSSDWRIDDVGCVRRARLNCRAMENILLCDESLAACSHTPASALSELIEWVQLKPSHQATPGISALIANFSDRRTYQIKEVRNVLVGVLGISKPWEVHVGQVIAQRLDASPEAENSLRTYLGPGALEKIFRTEA